MILLKRPAQPAMLFVERPIAPNLHVPPKCQERQKRFDIFTSNVQHIEKHNAAGHSYQLGITAFTDLKPEERTAEPFLAESFPAASFRGHLAGYLRTT